MQDGVFSSTAQAIAQTSDGYLWLGTESGLFRFDGVQFVPWNGPGNSAMDQRIFALHAAHDGSLWIGTGSGLSHLRDGRIENLKTDRRINAIAETSDGTIWIAGRTNAPLCEVKANEIHCHTEGFQFPDYVGLALAVDRSDRPWLVCCKTSLAYWDNASGVNVSLKTLLENRRDSKVDTVAASPDGSVWAAISSGKGGPELRQYQNGLWKKVLIPKFGDPETSINKLLPHADGTLWIGTSNHGLLRLANGEIEKFDSSNGLSGDYIQDLFEDREGTLWIATSEGIDSFHDLRVVTFSKREGLTADSVSSILADQKGRIWMGNLGSLDVLENGKISSIRTGYGLPGRMITALFEDHAGRLWVGIDNGLWVYDGTHFTQILKPDGTPLGMTFILAEDAHNDIWIRGVGIFHLHGLKVVEEFSDAHYPVAFSLLPAADSGMWLGYRNGALGRLRNGHLQHYPAIPGVNGKVLSLWIGPDTWVWGIASDALFAWHENESVVLSQRNGLPCKGLFSLREDDNHTIWMSTQCGYLSIPYKELEEWRSHPDSVVHFRVLGVFDGAQPGLPSFDPSSSIGPDGRLWFANDRIVQMIDPAKLQVNRVVPPVHIQQLFADRKVYAPQNGLRIPRLSRDIEFNYAGLSFVTPQNVRFRYKLDGWDKDWQDAGTRRQAFYTNLDPGHYIFRVTACNKDGVWNDNGAELGFYLPPAFYQTYWFKALCVVLAAAALWVVYRTRLRHATAQARQRISERLSERERIARELHDTLLQGFHGIVLLFQMAADQIGKNEPARKLLDQALEQSDKVIIEGRERVMNLRTFSNEDLAKAFLVAGDELNRTMPCNFRVVVRGEVKQLHPVLRDETYRIGREAITNAFRHAHATEVETEITYKSNELQLSFRDNGYGIERGVLDAGERQGHWGLVGMRERAWKIGARLEVWSRSGSGTQIELCIPADIAYVAKRKSRSLRWLKKLRQDAGEST